MQKRSDIICEHPPLLSICITSPLTYEHLPHVLPAATF